MESPPVHPIDTVAAVPRERPLGRAPRVTRNLILITAVMIMAVAAILTHTHLTLEGQRHDAILIDMAGRQRAFIHKYTSDLILGHNVSVGRHAYTAALLTETLDALIDGGSVVLNYGRPERIDIAAAPTPRIRAKLVEQRELLRRYLVKAEAFLDVEPGSEQFLIRLKTLNDLSDVLYVSAEDAVKLYRGHVLEKRHEMIRREAAIGGFAVLLCAVLAFQVRRVTQSIEREVARRRQIDRTRRKYEFIVKSAGEFMALINRKYEFEAVNDAFCRVMGRAPDEILGRRVDDIQGEELFEQTFRPQIDACFAGTSAAHQQWIDFPSAGRLFVDIHCYPYSGEDGHVSHAVIIARDITTRQTALDELAAAHRTLRKSHDQLEERVSDRTEKWQRINKDLETVLYAISHDLKEPLRAIENFSGLVYERCADRLDADGRDYLDRVVRASKRMRRHLDDVLTLSRAGRIGLDRRPMPARQIVEEAMALMHEKIRESRAKIELGPDLPLLWVDRSWAVIAVQNLISNAVKFTRNGDRPEVDIRAWQDRPVDPDRAGLIVADRGPGIPDTMRERIFQLFQRGVGQEIEGTGAGLAIVREIARKHGGDVSHRPREGGGSEFILSFSARPDSDGANEAEL